LYHSPFYLNYFIFNVVYFLVTLYFITVFSFTFLNLLLPGALSLGVKRLESEADHSTSSSAEDKNAWSYTSTPQYAFMAWCSVKLYYCGRGEGTYKNVSW